MKKEKCMPGTAGCGAHRLRNPLAEAFTLIELLVSITFLVILMLVVTQVMGIVQRTWVRTNSRVSQFREARRAFDLISNNLSQATLNTYWTSDLKQLSSDNLGQAIQSPSSYKRQSELHFICGPTPVILPPTGGGASTNYPGHAVFFQAPLGVVRTDTKAQAAAAAGKTTQNVADTANLSNLLCGRGYFVEWGSDALFRPSFLNSAPYTTLVPTRNRLRLMEYSPTADMNSIYDSDYRTNPGNIRNWYQNSVTGALATNVQNANGNDSTNFGRYYTRPVAENILALIIAPQRENTGASGNVNADVYDLAPNYLYDSFQTGNVTSNTGSQGTQHLLPPMIKLTMIALDERSGEMLSTDANNNSVLIGNILKGMATLFSSANSYTSDLEGTPQSPGTLKTLLLNAKLNYRVFTTTIALKQARWSY